MTDLLRHEPGVYFGLPDSAYFRDPALGSSDLKRLLIGPADYWCASLYNPDRTDESTRYKDRGHGLHCHVLFGEDEFRKQFERELLKEDHPDALVTVDDLKRALKQIGMATTGKKDELIARLKGSSSLFTIWDDLVEAQKAAGKTVLKAEDYSRILIASAMIKKNPSLAGCFENGVPEVSVFWEVDGVRMRSRFDYLKMNSVVDLKSFTNTMNRPIAQAINSAFFNYRYDVQASLYLNARQVMRQFVRDGRVFGEIDRDWLNILAEIDDFVFAFVFHQMGGATVTRGVWVRPGGYVDGAASVDIARAIDIWKKNHEIFGTEMWADMEPLAEVLQEDVPMWIGR